MPPIRIERTQHRLLHDTRRVLAKQYLPGEEVILPGESRAQLLMTRVLAIPDDKVLDLNADVARRFAGRHHDLNRILDRNFDAVAHYVPGAATLSAERRRLIGAYFTHEY